MAFKTFGRLAGRAYTVKQALKETSPANTLTPFDPQLPATKFMSYGEDATSLAFNRALSALASNIESITQTLTRTALRTERILPHKNEQHGIAADGVLSGHPNLSCYVVSDPPNILSDNPQGIDAGQEYLHLTDSVGGSGQHPNTWIYVGLHKRTLTNFVKFHKTTAYDGPYGAAHYGDHSTYTESAHTALPTDVHDNPVSQAAGESYFTAQYSYKSASQEYWGSLEHSLVSHVPPIKPIAVNCPPYAGGSQKWDVNRWDADGFYCKTAPLTAEHMKIVPGCFVEISGNQDPTVPELGPKGETPGNNGLFAVSHIIHNQDLGAQGPGDKFILTRGGLWKITVDDVTAYNAGELVSWACAANHDADTWNTPHERTNFGHVMYVIPRDDMSATPTVLNNTPVPGDIYLADLGSSRDYASTGGLHKFHDPGNGVYGVPNAGWKVGAVHDKAHPNGVTEWGVFGPRTSYGDAGLIDRESDADQNWSLRKGTRIYNYQSTVEPGVLLPNDANGNPFSAYATVLDVIGPDEPVVFDVDGAAGQFTPCNPIGFLLNPSFTLSADQPFQNGDYLAETKTLTTVWDQLNSKGSSANSGTFEDPSAEILLNANDVLYLKSWQNFLRQGYLGSRADTVEGINGSTPKPNSLGRRVNQADAPTRQALGHDIWEIKISLNTGGGNGVANGSLRNDPSFPSDGSYIPKTWSQRVAIYNPVKIPDHTTLSTGSHSRHFRAVTASVLSISAGKPGNIGAGEQLITLGMVTGAGDRLDTLTQDGTPWNLPSQGQPEDILDVIAAGCTLETHSGHEFTILEVVRRPVAYYRDGAASGAAPEGTWVPTWGLNAAFHCDYDSNPFIRGPQSGLGNRIWVPADLTRWEDGGKHRPFTTILGTFSYQIGHLVQSDFSLATQSDRISLVKCEWRNTEFRADIALMDATEWIEIANPDPTHSPYDEPIHWKKDTLTFQDRSTQHSNHLAEHVFADGNIFLSYPHKEHQERFHDYRPAGLSNANYDWGVWRSPLTNYKRIPEEIQVKSLTGALEGLLLGDTRALSYPDNCPDTDHQEAVAQLDTTYGMITTGVLSGGAAWCAQNMGDTGPQNDDGDEETKLRPNLYGGGPLGSMEVIVTQAFFYRGGAKISVPQQRLDVSQLNDGANVAPYFIDFTIPAQDDRVSLYYDLDAEEYRVQSSRMVYSPDNPYTLSSQVHVAELHIGWPGGVATILACVDVRLRACHADKRQDIFVGDMSQAYTLNYPDASMRPYTDAGMHFRSLGEAFQAIRYWSENSRMSLHGGALRTWTVRVVSDTHEAECQQRGITYPIKIPQDNIKIIGESMGKILPLSYKTVWSDQFDDFHIHQSSYFEDNTPRIYYAQGTTRNDVHLAPTGITTNARANGLSETPMPADVLNEGGTAATDLFDLDDCVNVYFEGLAFVGPRYRGLGGGAGEEPLPLGTDRTGGFGGSVIVNSSDRWHPNLVASRRDYGKRALLGSYRNQSTMDHIPNNFSRAGGLTFKNCSLRYGASFVKFVESDISSLDDITIEGCAAYYPAYGFVHIDSWIAKYHQNIVIRNNYAVQGPYNYTDMHSTEACVGKLSAVALTNCKDVVIENNRFEGFWKGVFLKQGCTNAKIQGNRIMNTFSNGIHTRNGSDRTPSIFITNNEIINAGWNRAYHGFDDAWPNHWEDSTLHNQESRYAIQCQSSGTKIDGNSIRLDYWVSLADSNEPVPQTFVEKGGGIAVTTYETAELNEGTTVTNNKIDLEAYGRTGILFEAGPSANIARAKVTNNNVRQLWLSSETPDGPKTHPAHTSAQDHALCLSVAAQGVGLVSSLVVSNNTLEGHLYLHTGSEGANVSGNTITLGHVHNAAPGADTGGHPLSDTPGKPSWYHAGEPLGVIVDISGRDSVVHNNNIHNGCIYTGSQSTSCDNLRITNNNLSGRASNECGTHRSRGIFVIRGGHNSLISGNATNGGWIWVGTQNQVARNVRVLGNNTGMSSHESPSVFPAFESNGGVFRCSSQMTAWGANADWLVHGGSIVMGSSNGAIIANNQTKGGDIVYGTRNADLTDVLGPFDPPSDDSYFGSSALSSCWVGQILGNSTEGGDITVVSCRSMQIANNNLTQYWQYGGPAYIEKEDCGYAKGYTRSGSIFVSGSANLQISENQLYEIDSNGFTNGSSFSGAQATPAEDVQEWYSYKVYRDGTLKDAPTGVIGIHDCYSATVNSNTCAAVIATDSTTSTIKSNIMNCARAYGTIIVEGCPGVIVEGNQLLRHQDSYFDGYNEATDSGITGEPHTQYSSFVGLKGSNFWSSTQPNSGWFGGLISNNELTVLPPQSGDDNAWNEWNNWVEERAAGAIFLLNCPMPKVSENVAWTLTLRESFRPTVTNNTFRCGEADPFIAWARGSHSMYVDYYSDHGTFANNWFITVKAGGDGPGGTNYNTAQLHGKPSGHLWIGNRFGDPRFRASSLTTGRFQWGRGGMGRLTVYEAGQNILVGNSSVDNWPAGGHNNTITDPADAGANDWRISYLNAKNAANGTNQFRTRWGGHFEFNPSNGRPYEGGSNVYTRATYSGLVASGNLTGIINDRYVNHYPNDGGQGVDGTIAAANVQLSAGWLDIDQNSLSSNYFDDGCESNNLGDGGNDHNEGINPIVNSGSQYGPAT
jgi:hypothetical protein